MADTMDVDSYLTAGQFVKDLALGDQEVPDTTSGLETLLNVNTVDIPAGELPHVQRDTEKLFNVVLREKTSLQEDWDRISQDDGIYRMPDEVKAMYEQYINNPGDFEGPGPDRIKKRQELFLTRLADYTFSSCGG